MGCQRRNHTSEESENIPTACYRPKLQSAAATNWTQCCEERPQTLSTESAQKFAFWGKMAKVSALPWLSVWLSPATQPLKLSVTFSDSSCWDPQFLCGLGDFCLDKSNWWSLAHGHWYDFYFNTSNFSCFQRGGIFTNELDVKKALTHERVKDMSHYLSQICPGREWHQRSGAFAVEGSVGVCHSCWRQASFLYGWFWGDPLRAWESYLVQMMLGLSENWSCLQGTLGKWAESSNWSPLTATYSRSPGLTSCAFGC